MRIGCVAYWLLTGTHGLQRRNADADHDDAGEPWRPIRRRSEAGVRSRRELEAIVLACLAKEPASRPQSVDELSSRLAAVPLERSWGRDEAMRWWASEGGRRDDQG